MNDKKDKHKQTDTLGAGGLNPSVVPYVTGSEVDPTQVTSAELDTPHMKNSELSDPIIVKGRIN